MLSSVTTEILDVLQNAFHQVCRSNRCGCAEKTQHIHTGNIKYIKFSIPAVVLINVPALKRTQKDLKIHTHF